MALFLIGLLLAIAGGVTALVCLVSAPIIRKTIARCTVATQGTYLYQESVAHVHTGALGGGRGDAYAAVVRFNAGPRTVQTPVSYSEGIGTLTPTDSLVEVYYDPQNPAVCWARIPGTARSMARLLPILQKVGLGALAAGIVMMILGHLFM